MYAMNTRWESLVALAREMDADCAAGVPPDFTRVSRLVRAVVDFHSQLSPGIARAPRGQLVTKAVVG